MKYQIANRKSGVILGVYEGDDPAEALNAMAIESGYEDYADLQSRVSAKSGDIVVEEVGE